MCQAALVCQYVHFCAKLSTFCQIVHCSMLRQGRGERVNQKRAALTKKKEKNTKNNCLLLLGI